LTPPGTDPSTVSKWTLLASGGMGGIGYWCFAFPQDLVKSVIQTQNMNLQSQLSTVGNHTNIKTDIQYTNSFFSTMKRLIEEGGIRRLFRGFPIALSRAFPGGAVTFTVYQSVINLLNQ
jgi:hypothetical protein